MTAAAPHDNLVDRAELLPLLGDVKQVGDWTMAWCPAHSDGTKAKRRSLGLSKTGVLKCFAGCDFKAIMEGLRGPNHRPPENTPRLRGDTPPNPGSPDRKLTNTYQYCDKDGQLVAFKLRYETSSGQKDFRWHLPGGTGGGLGDMAMTDMPLYGAELLSARPNEPVYFVEGEKAAHACRDEGLLAVTHGGGASTKDFGACLEDLRDRDVLLWPDNDGPGHSYMALLETKLRHICRSVGVIHVALPEKGDAYDYFSLGGTVEGLAEGIESNEPVTEVLATDALRITMRSATGSKIVLAFSEMEKIGRNLDAELLITCPESGQRPYSQRMNLLSPSARTDLRRDLEQIFGKDLGWAGVLNTAVAIARETYLNQDRGFDVFDIEDPTGDVMLADPLLVSDGATIFFGDGSSMKSYLLNGGISLAMGMGTDFVGVQMPSLRVMVVDYEDSGANFRRRLTRVAKGYGLDAVPPAMVYYWPANGIPLKDQWEAIKRKCVQEGIGYLIVDSVVPACAGDPNDSPVASEFFRALKKIDLPSALIAHITKSGDNNTLKPFGSNFWHNLARRTWYVSRVQEEGSDDVDIGLYCRKVNDGQLPRPLAYHVHFDGKDGPVTFSKGDMSKPELMMQTTAKNQIWSVLREPMTVKEIAEETDMSVKTVEKTLERNPSQFIKAGPRVGKVGGRPAMMWQRAWGALASLPGSEPESE